MFIVYSEGLTTQTCLTNCIKCNFSAFEALEEQTAIVEALKQENDDLQQEIQRLQEDFKQYSDKLTNANELSNETVLQLQEENTKLKEIIQSNETAHGSGTCVVDAGTCTELEEPEDSSDQEQLLDVDVAELKALRVDNEALREKQKVLMVMQQKLEDNARLMTSTTQVMHEYDSTLASRKKVFEMEIESVEDIVQKRGEEVDMLKHIIRSQEDVISKNTAELLSLETELHDNREKLTDMRTGLDNQIVLVQEKQALIDKLNENLANNKSGNPALQDYVEHLSAAMASYIGTPQGVSLTCKSNTM